MKTTRFLFFVAFIAFAVNLKAQTQTINISTGYNQSTSTLIPPFSTDPDWDVVQLPSFLGYTSTSVVGVGAGPPSGCSMSIGFGNASGATFMYRVKFIPQIPSTCPASASLVDAKINFTWTNADDQLLRVYINGTSTSDKIKDFTTGPGPIPGNISPGWVKNNLYSISIPLSSISISTANYLYFEVLNANSSYINPTWLDICANVELTYNSPLSPPVFATASSVCDGSPVAATPSPLNDPAINGYCWFITECNSTGTSLIGPTWPTPANLSSVVWTPGFPLAQYLFPASALGGLQCGKYYQIKLAVKSNCSNWAEYNQVIYINCGPNIDIGLDEIICQGDCITLKDKSGPKKKYINNWYDQSAPLVSLGNSNSITVCPTQTTTYCLTETSTLTGCSTTKCVTLYVDVANPAFTLSFNTSNPLYYEVTALPNQVPPPPLPGSFAYEWYLDQLTSIFTPPAFSVVNPPCWQVFPLITVNNFWDFDGTVPTFACSFSPLPPSGKFKYGVLYRITRVAYTEICPKKQYAVLIKIDPSDPASGLPYAISVVEDPNAPDLTGKNNKIFALDQLQEVDNSLLMVYPNPTNSSLTIKYALADESTGKIEIADLTGRIVKTASLNTALNQINVDLTPCMNGAYFVRLYESNKLIATKKVIVAK